MESKPFSSIFIADPFPQTHVKWKARGLTFGLGLLVSELFPLPFHLPRPLSDLRNLLGPQNAHPAARFCTRPLPTPTLISALDSLHSGGLVVTKYLNHEDVFLLCQVKFSILFFNYNVDWHFIVTKKLNKSDTASGRTFVQYDFIG